MVTEEDVADICPLAPMQRLFLAASDLDRDLGMAQLRYELHGPIRSEVLEQAWRFLVQRHSILRTAIVTDDVDEPLQVVLRDPALAFGFEDLRELAPEERQKRLAEYLAHDRERKIDRNTPPLMRVWLFRNAEEEFLMCWSFERLLLDGWSLKLLLQELSCAYHAFAEGRRPALPPAVPYGDFIRWLTARDFRSGTAYWRELLAGYQFRRLFVSPSTQASAPQPYCPCELSLSAAATSAIRQCARTLRITLNTFAEAAWATVLTAYSNDPDVLYGLTVTGRPADLPGVERIAGLFTNNLPRRVRLHRDLAIRTLLRQLNTQQLAGSAFEQMPITEIQNAVGLPAGHRLFETLVVCNSDSGGDDLDFGPDITFADLNKMLPNGYAVTLTAIPGSRLHLCMAYNGLLIDSDTAERLVRSVACVLERLPSVLDGNVDELIAIATEAIGGITAAPARPRVTAGARDAVELQIVGLFQQAFGRRDIGANDDFFALGGHSLLAVWLYSKLEEICGRKLPLASLLHNRTPAAIAGLLKNESYAPTWSSLVPINPGGTRLPFFCIHGGGGNVLFYRELAARLGPDQPFYALQPQGMDGKLPTHTTVEEMAEHYIAEIRQLQATGPYRIGGTSFGGMVAFEMACRLAREGHEIGLVALFDTHGPGYPQFRPRTSKWQKRLFRWWERVWYHVQNLWLLDNPGRAEYLSTKYAKGKHMLRLAVKRSRKWLSREWRQLLGSELPPDLVRTQNAILTALQSYRPGYYEGELTLFRASRQPLGVIPERTLGWAPHAKSVRVIDVQGYHTGIILEPHVRFNVDKLKAELSREDALRDRQSSQWTLASNPVNA